jgi:urease accessory protein
MYDAVSQSDPGALQRASGELRVSFRCRGEATVLDDLRQAGCLKVRFPRVEPDAWVTAVTLNTSGGVAGGDRLNSSIEVQRDGRATITAQAAERFYRVLPGNEAADVRTSIDVANNAAVEWLPQETLLFDRCALNRRLTVNLADNAWFLGVESLVFGRAAMGERLHHARLRDVISVRRGGRLLLHDAVRIDGDVEAALRRKVVADGAGAVATLLHVAPAAETALDIIRAALASQPTAAGASAWNGMLVARILAATGERLRAAVMTVLQALRGSRPLPRMWTC